MSQNVRQNNLFAAEDYTKIYKSFQNVNFIAYDVDSIQTALIDNLRLNYPENYNDYVQSSEMVAHIQLLSYIASSLAFRTDLNARENIIDTAERRESIIRLARMINYQPKRNIALRGIMKIDAVQTDAPLKDNLGRDLQNRTIFWDDANNVDSYDQFITILDSVMSASNPFGKPYKKQVINNIPTSLYQLNNKKNVEVAYPVTIKANGKSLAVDMCNPDLDSDGVLSELHPDPQNAFNIIHRNDGQGLSSDNTGFFLYFKQGRMIKKDYKFDFAVKNRVVDVDVKNINETDVFVQEINNSGEVLQKWTKIPNVNGGTNIIYNAISINDRNLYAVLPDTDDKIKLNFADGNFGNIPTGVFRTWVRPSINQNITLRPEQASGLEVVIPYIDKEGQNHNLRVIFSLKYTVSNSSVSETPDQIKTRAPQVYYTQDRMVNNEDYNVFPLTRGNEIVKVRTINRTHAGHSRYIDINDPTGYHQDLFITSDDGALYKDSTMPLSEVVVNSDVSNEPTTITSVDLTQFLSNDELNNFFYDEYISQYKTNKQNSHVDGDSYNKYNVYEFVYGNGGTEETAPYNFKPSPDSDYDNKGTINSTIDPHRAYSHSEPTETEKSYGKFIFMSVGSKIKFINPANNAEEKYVSVTSITTDASGSLFVFDSEVNKNWIVKEIFPKFRTHFSNAETNIIKANINNKNNFGLVYDVEKDIESNIENNGWLLTDSINATLGYVMGVDGRDWIVNAQYDSVDNKYIFTSRGTNYVFESFRDVRFFFDVDQYNFDIISGKARRDIIEVTTQNSMPQIKETWVYKNGSWVNVDDETIIYAAGSTSYIPFQTRYMDQSDVIVSPTMKQPSSVNLRGPFDLDYATVGMVKISGTTPIAGDEISITYIDKIPQLKYSVNWGIHDHLYQEDGYLDTSKVIVSPSDLDNDGIPDIMFSFQKLVADNSVVFFENNVTYDGYQNKRLWVSNWKDYRGELDSGMDVLTFDDIINIDLFLVDVKNVEALKSRINAIIVDSVLAPINSSIYKTEEQLNKLNTTDVTIIYTERLGSNGVPIIDNSSANPIFEKINVDIDKVVVVRTNLLELNNDITQSGVIGSAILNPVTFVLDENHYIKHGRSFTENAIQNPNSIKTFDYKWHHYAPTDNRIDPSISNLMDMTILTLSYYKDVLIWKNKRQSLAMYPSAPSSEELRLQFGDLNSFKMQSDQIIFNSGKFKLLFGKNADRKLQAKFKIVKSPTAGITDNEAKTKVIEAIDIFFDIQNWDFGESFYYTELAAFIHRYMAKYISSVVIVPVDANAKFGDLFQIKAEPTEMFISIATIDDVEVVANLTDTNMRA